MSEKASEIIVLIKSELDWVEESAIDVLLEDIEIILDKD